MNQLHPDCLLRRCQRHKCTSRFDSLTPHTTIGISSQLLVKVAFRKIKSWLKTGFLEPWVVSTHLFFVLLRTTLYKPLTLTQFDPFSSPCVDVFCIFLRVPSACVFKVQIMSSSVRKTFSWKAVLLLFLLFWAEQSAENISGSQLPPGEFVVSCSPLSAYSVVTQ